MSQAEVPLEQIHVFYGKWVHSTHSKLAVYNKHIYHIFLLNSMSNHIYIDVTITHYCRCSIIFINNELTVNKYKITYINIKDINKYF